MSTQNLDTEGLAKAYSAARTRYKAINQYAWHAVPKAVHAVMLNDAVDVTSYQKSIVSSLMAAYLHENQAKIFEQLNNVAWADMQAAGKALQASIDEDLKREN